MLHVCDICVWCICVCGVLHVCDISVCVCAVHVCGEWCMCVIYMCVCGVWGRCRCGTCVWYGVCSVICLSSFLLVIELVVSHIFLISCH